MPRTDTEVLEETIERTDREFQKAGNHIIYLKGIFWVLVQALQIYIGRSRKR